MASTQGSDQPEIGKLQPLRTAVTEDLTAYQQQLPAINMPRPSKFNSSGTAVLMDINSHKVIAYPDKTVYQYDVSRTEESHCAY